MLKSNINVCQGLCLNTLRGIYNQNSAFTGSQAARYLVGKVHMAGSVNKVKLIGLAIRSLVVKPHSFGFNCNASLPLQIHLVHHLFLHVPELDCIGYLQQTVGQGGLPMVNMGYDTKVTKMVHTGNMVAY